MSQASDPCGLTRRAVLAGAIASAAFPRIAAAALERHQAPEFSPPLDNREDFIRWMEINRGEQAPLLANRWERYLALRSNRDIWGPQDAAAFLMTPRDQFVLAQDMIRAYDNAYLNIGHGATISGPGIVARMTSALEVSPGDHVLEIGTGSGYQSAYLAYLTDKVWTVEIVGELADNARARHENLVERGYREYASISTKQGNGYFGWAEAAPFDKIVVTCAVDHIPQPLFDQLKPGGMMILPLGHRAMQHIIKVVKASSSSPRETVDLYHGKLIHFLPMRI
ncbi:MULTISPECIES: protein-L-isoaspartate O-methyltransferase family protein [unclassified Bradyrhizobium]|uniref:protein-L-isoaspartate O-methyltransferase family protein n=1 Tax=unclassified Bradyrhizobium TaxID=2631580 RepID=UPI0003F8D1A8|nr:MULTISPECIES: protein-L-isoaspartate O-methyltransferase [unclassified Bradyrhizobium]QIG91128.1 protein-L-isoaspartate O-methyltransferase [Bradyrhizobium sp. 6(2017)]